MMHPALRYLLVRQSIGGMRHRISRLRNPRYLVIVLVGVGYFWLTFGMPGVWTSDKNPFGQYVSLMPTFGGFALGSLLTLHWFTAATRPAPPFSVPEASQLFVLPFSRRELVTYRLVRPQFAFLLLAAVAALLSLRARTINPLFAGVAAYLVLNVIWFNGMAASLVMSRLQRASWPRLLLNLPGLLLLAYLVLPLLPGILRASRAGDGMDALAIISAESATAAHWPLHSLAQIPVSSGAGQVLFGAGTAVALCALLYGACMWLAGPFEEQALAQAETMGRRVDAVRRGGLGGLKLSSLKAARSTRLPLATKGAAWVAVFWKTVVGEWRGGPWRMMYVISVLLVIGVGAAAAFQAQRPIWIGLAVTSITMAVPLGVMTPRLMVTGMHSEVRRLELLKSLPLSGYHLLRGKTWAGALMTLVPAGALSIVISTSVMFAVDETIPWLIPTAIAAVPVLAIGAALMVALESGVVLMLPAWTVTTQGEAAVEQVGRNLVSLVVRFFVGSLLLILPGMAGGLVGGTLYAVGLKEWGIAPGAIAGALVLAAEVELALKLIGVRYDRMEVTEEG